MHKTSLEKRYIHICTSKDIHVEFKRICSNHRVSMQEIVEYFISGVVDNKDEMKIILKEFVKLKKERKINKIAKVEVDELYKRISGESNEDF